MIHTGIVGFGKMGRIRAQALRESERADVLTVFDPTPGTAPEGATFAATPEQILADPRLDAVFICTPNYMNKALTIAALRAGKHVFCEKPPAFTSQDVIEIREAEKEADRFLMYGFNHRYHASIQKIKQIVDSKEMGRVLWMRGRYGKEVDANFFKGWRAQRELAGGGIMLDQGIHMLDLFLFLGGDFDEVQAMVSNLYWKIEGIEDNVFANFRSSRTGICASLHSTMTQWRYLFSLEVFLEQGAIILNGLKTSSGAYGDEDLSVKRTRQTTHQGTFDAEQRITYHTDTSWTAEVMSFLDGIERGGPWKMESSMDALKVMTLMDRIYGKSQA